MDKMDKNIKKKYEKVKGCNHPWQDAKLDCKYCNPHMIKHIDNEKCKKLEEAIIALAQCLDMFELQMFPKNKFVSREELMRRILK